MLSGKNKKPPIRISHCFVEYIPPKGKLEERVLYISIDYKQVTHLCACGCKTEISTPLSPRDWNITFNGDTVSLSPSVGSWSLPCRSHYFIRNNTIIWASDWSDEKIKKSRETEKVSRGKGSGKFDTLV